MEALKKSMTKKKLNILSKEIENKCSCICQFNPDNSGHPISKVRNQTVEEDYIQQMEKTAVHVKEERVNYKVHCIEECCVHLELFTMRLILSPNTAGV